MSNKIAYSALTTLDDGAITLEMIINTLDIVLDDMESRCPTFNPSKPIDNHAACRFVESFRVSFSSLTHLSICLHRLMKDMDKSLDDLYEKVRKEK